MITPAEGCMRTSYWAMIILAVAVHGCSCDQDANNGGNDDMAVSNGDGSGMAVCIPDLTMITLAPADSMQTLDGNAANPISFTATGTHADGSMTTIDPANLSWTATRPTDDTPPGMIVNGVLMPNPSAGGTVTITADDGCGHKGTTTITFKLDATIGTPLDPAAWMGTPDTSGTLP